MKITNPNIASIILKLMSLDYLGNKQTIILHNYEINNEKYDLVITPHTQSKGYIRTKRQTPKKKNFEQTKKYYTKKILKTKKRILRFGNKSFRRTLHIKRLRKKNIRLMIH